MLSPPNHTQLSEERTSPAGPAHTRRSLPHPGAPAASTPRFRNRLLIRLLLPPPSSRLPTDVSIPARSGARTGSSQRGREAGRRDEAKSSGCREEPSAPGLAVPTAGDAPRSDTYLRKPVPPPWPKAAGERRSRRRRRASFPGSLPALPAAAVPLPPCKYPPHWWLGRGGGPGSRSRGCCSEEPPKWRREARGAGGGGREAPPEPSAGRARAEAAPLPRRAGGSTPGPPSHRLKGFLSGWVVGWVLVFLTPIQAQPHTHKSPPGTASCQQIEVFLLLPLFPAGMESKRRVLR